MGRVWMQRAAGICGSAQTLTSSPICRSGATAMVAWRAHFRGGTAPTGLRYAALFSIASSSTSGGCAPDSATFSLKMKNGTPVMPCLRTLTSCAAI